MDTPIAFSCDVLKLNSFHFESLPASTPENRGMIAVVIDSTASAWGEKISGGGTATVLAWCDGEAWKVIGR